MAIAPQNCLVLEDSNAGMLPVMVTDMLAPSTQTRALARHILPTLREVIGLLPPCPK